MKSQAIYSVIARMTFLYDFVATIVGYKKSIDYFISQLPYSEKEVIKILDAGCGAGLYSFELLKKYENSHITAFDLNGELVDRLRQKVLKKGLEKRIYSFTANIQNPLVVIQNEKFDMIITAGVLEYVSLEKTVKSLSNFLNSASRGAKKPFQPQISKEATPNF